MKKFKQVLRIDEHTAALMQAACESVDKTLPKTLPAFDEEVIFPDGRRMTIQVCPGDGEPCWTQGVLYSPEGEELAFTEPQDDLKQPFTIDCDAVEYSVQVITYRAEILAEIEELEQIAQDTKKRFSYSKSEGTWAWYDSDEDDQVDAWHTGFETRFDALVDAVEPYLNPEGDSDSEED
jgi:hypothetical protein